MSFVFLSSAESAGTSQCSRKPRVGGTSYRCAERQDNNTAATAPCGQKRSEVVRRVSRRGRRNFTRPPGSGVSGHSAPNKMGNSKSRATLQHSQRRHLSESTGAGCMMPMSCSPSTRVRILDNEWKLFFHERNAPFGVKVLNARKVGRNGRDNQERM